MDLSSTFFPGFVINNLDNKVKNKIKCNVLNMDYAGECPSICPVCGETLIGHGKRTLEITDTPIMGDPGLLHLRIPRRRCSACKYLWQPKIQYVDENHLLTERAFTDISQKAIKQPFSDVGKEYAQKLYNLLTEETLLRVFIDSKSNLSTNDTTLALKQSSVVVLLLTSKTLETIKREMSKRKDERSMLIRELNELVKFDESRIIPLNIVFPKTGNDFNGTLSFLILLKIILIVKTMINI